VPAEENKQLVRRLIDRVWNQHDAAAIGDHFGPGLQQEIAEHHRQLLAGFPDLQVTVEDDLIAEADRVVARLLLRGTHSGPFAGRPATGEVVAWGSIRIYRVRDGRVVETWAMQDRLGLLQQLGAVLPVEGVNWAGGGAGGTDRPTQQAH
jgi:predicted ester cyclase